MKPESSLPHSQFPTTCPYPEPARSTQVVPQYQSRSQAFLANDSNTISFYGKELLTPRPNPKLEDHPLSAVRDCLFNIFAATLHTAGRSSIRNLWTHHAVVTGTHLSHMENLTASVCKLIQFNFLCNNPSKNTSIKMATINDRNMQQDTLFIT